MNREALVKRLNARETVREFVRGCDMVRGAYAQVSEAKAVFAAAFQMGGDSASNLSVQDRHGREPYRDELSIAGRLLAQSLKRERELEERLRRLSQNEEAALITIGRSGGFDVTTTRIVPPPKPE